MGLFHVVRFPEPWPTVGYLENIRGGDFVEGIEDVLLFETAFERIVAAARSVDDSRETIEDLLERTTT
jgi:hypothetical protein